MNSPQSFRSVLPMLVRLRGWVRGSLLAVGVLVASVGGGLHAETPPVIRRTAAELLPQSVVALAEVSGAEQMSLADAIQIILDSPLRHRVQSLPAYNDVLKSGALDQLQRGITAFETSMGKPWREAIATLTDGGITIAADSSSQGVAVLLQSSDVDMLERLRGFLLAVPQMRQGKWSAVEQGDYRGVTAYALGKQFKLAVLDHWMVITNKPEFGKAIIDRYLDRDHDSLSTSETFMLAMDKRSSPTTTPTLVFAYADLQALRSANLVKPLNNEKVDNPIAEVLFGGVLANLKHAPLATAALTLTSTSVELHVASPHQREWEAPREYFFGEAALAAAPPLLQVDDRLFAISAHRDLSQWWLRSGDLLSDKANDGIAKADTQLSTFFSGRDFGEDILGALHSDVQIVGKAQDFSAVLPRPAIQLPAFAIQFRMKTPAETKPEFRRVFQSFIGFLNVVGAMNGQPQFDLGLESLQDATLVTATYVPSQQQRESTEAPINFNFSPTIAFAKDRVILASSSALARELTSKPELASPAEAESGSETATTDPVNHNTTAHLDANTLRRLLSDNQSQLVANNMLEKGHDQQAAEAEIGLLLELVGLFKDARIDFDTADDALSLNVRIHADEE